MAKNDDALAKRAAKARAKAEELLRIAQRAETAMAERERKTDTRRKILIGSWALDKCEKSEEFAADMQRDLSRFWLVRDDDRAMFSLEPLTPEQKTARGISPLAARGRKGKAPAVSEPVAPDASEPAIAFETDEAAE